MAIWVTSDFHFNHKKILNTCRDFYSIKDHNEYIVSQYNSVVAKDDLVYVLGDIGFYDLKYVGKWIKKLNGRKILILGNHDQGSIEEYKRMGFIDVVNHPIYYSDKIILSHFPAKEAFQNQFCINVHGHLHGAILSLPNYFNCNLEMTNYKPINIKQFEEIAEEMCKPTRNEPFTTEWYYPWFQKIDN